MEYYDEITKVESSVDGQEEVTPAPADFAVKVLQLYDLSLELGSCPCPCPGSSSAAMPGGHVVSH